MTRPFCHRCLRAAVTCPCDRIAPFESGPRLAFLMHRKERRDRSGTGTGRIAHLFLSNSTLHVGLSFEGDPGVEALLSDPLSHAVVLSPGAGSLDLASPGGMARLRDEAGGRRPVVFVLDGSWSGARKLLEANPRLAKLPRISFSTGRTSRFGFKTQPHPECLSTLEAAHEMIGLFDEADFHATSPLGVRDRLTDLFHALVEAQGAFSMPGRRRTREEPCKGVMGSNAGEPGARAGIPEG